MMTNLLHGAHVANKLFSTIARLRLLLVMFLTLTVSAEVWGALSSPYTCTFTTNLTLSNDQVKTGDVTWTLSTTIGAGTPATDFGNTNGQSAIKLGSGKKNYYSKMTLTTSAFSTYNVSKVVLYISSNNGGSKTITVKQGDTQIGTGDQSFSSATWVTNCTRNSTKGSGGDLSIEISSDATATFIHSITVTYEENSCSVKPTVGATLQSLSTTENSITATIPISSIGGCNITENGLVYSTSNAEPTVGGSGCSKVTTTACGSTAANKTVTITGLTCGQSYYIRGYATNEAGTSYTNVTTKSTSDCPKYTVTLVPGSGSVTYTELEEPNAGEGVTLPTPTLDCGDWEFAGWKTTSAVTTETTTEPTLIPAGAYSPTSDITLYAVYQRTEGGGGGGEASLTKMVAGNTLSDGDKIVVVANETYTAMYQETIESSYVNKWDCSTLTADVVADDDKNWWTVTMTDGGFYLGDDTNGYLNMSSNNLYCNTNKSVWTLLDLEDGTFKLQSNGRNLSYRSDLTTNPYWRMGGTSYGTSGQTILNLYKYTSGGGSSSTTYYHSTPDCGSTEPSPSLNADPTSLAFGNVATDSNKEMTFTLTGSDLTANATLALSGTNESMFSVNPTSVTQSEGSINQTITVTYTPTAAGEHTATLTISSTGAESKTVALSGTGTAPAAKYTVTFNAGSGTCGTESLTETSGGAGVTLPIATPSATCQSEGWTFAGWWTEAVAETTTSPGELLTANSNYKPTEDCTLYAVYSYTEAGGGGSGFYLSVTQDATTYYIGEKGSGSYLSAVTDINSAATFNIENNQYLYYGNKTYVSSTSDNTSLTIATTTPTVTWAITDDGETITFKSNGTGGRYLAFNYNSGSPRFSSYVSTYTYELTKHTTSTTTYNSNPVCVPSWSITYDFAGGTGSHCSNTSVPQGGSYTICEEEPIKEGYTFLGWSDGTSTYAAGATITPTKNITLTAQWQINTYTVTWSNNGVTTPITYEHGDDLTLPSEPASCDGVKEFVGWTEDNTFTYHATTPPSDLFTEKTATVTADATYYAVFATKGEGSANFVLGESGTFKMYANVNGTNYYAQGGVSSSKITGTTEAANASDYTLTHKGNNQYTIQLGNAYIGHSGTSSTDLNTTETTWTIQEGVNGSWRIVSPVNTSRALAYRASTYKIFKAYSMTSVEAGDTEYYDIEFGGTSSGYSDYTTICQQIESIEVQNPKTEFYLTDDFTIGEGKVMATLSDGITKVDVTSLATFSGYNMEVVGTYTVTVTYMGATATYNINVKPLDNAWVLTWNVSGKTNTGLGPRYVTKGSAIGTLPTPEVPAACAGKTFMGWTTSNIVPSDGVGIEYITEETVPTDNTTYYAVFATVNNFCTQKPIEDIASGSKVVIVAVASLTADGGSGKAISSRATDDTHNLQGDDVAIYDQTINTPHSTCIWTIAKEDGKCVFTQDGKYLNGVLDGKYSNLKYLETKDSWTLTPAASGMTMTYNMESTNASGEYIEWYNGKFAIHNEVNENGDFDMQFYVTANADGNADITDYTTGCEEYTITYYGFRGGYSTSTSSDGIIVLPVNSLHTVPDCGDVVTDHTNLGREFLNVWMTQPHGGHTFKPGDTFILTQDTTLYAQWKLETTSDVTTLPTDIEDMAGTDIYVYGGKTLNIQPGTTTINSLTLKGGLQSDGSYKMPIVWVPEGATLVRNSNKIYLDLLVNAKNYYPFAVPFATKNDQYLDYLDPVLNAASTYDKHFVIKTYDGALRATNGEDRAKNWVKVLRHATDKPSYLQPGVGYIIQALTYPDKDTATIRIPMTVPNTWFENGEQAVVGTTVRNTIAVTAHAGAAATEHQRHAGWNFVASPYLTNFAGGNVENDGGLKYINGELTVNGGWQYGGEEVPYVTIPAYDFSYYTQHKLSDVTLSPEWSFFVQIGTSGTMDFSTAGRQETPASIAARHDAAQSFKMDVDITLSDKNHSDQMGLIICDRFTSAYEVGYDLEKMFGSAYNLTVYTLMEDNTPLAYQALAIHSNMQVIPVGYRVPEQGDYTFALNQSTSSIDLLNEQYEQLILVDYETGALTNLLNSTYTFTSPRTQSDSRFAIYAVIRQKTPTDLPNIDDGDNSTRKILHNGHLYILREGKVYNGHGQIVK